MAQELLVSATPHVLPLLSPPAHCTHSITCGADPRSRQNRLEHDSGNANLITDDLSCTSVTLPPTRDHARSPACLVAHPSLHLNPEKLSRQVLGSHPGGAGAGIPSSRYMQRRYLTDGWMRWKLTGVLHMLASTRFIFPSGKIIQVPLEQSTLECTVPSIFGTCPMYLGF
ncbi:hypothetical protein P691DRAFT_43660 [Macrolepiota fuliginosa MF-IS2]|uniref:Uncharacterized protein n=1 Tax=Macrolepiota fuliginosa MF-IS2 TaxID=1400762 RepID=A0A9P6C902_9AGAR|nr:hypothetical protein P691DRAFT_43660 [Macrolepiota fuliginosa MF-IS2]